MSLQINGVWNTDPAMDRLERQREAELDSDCTGGADAAAYPTPAASQSPPAESPVQHKLPEAEARAIGRAIASDGVDRCEGELAPRQPEEVSEISNSETRPLRRGQPERDLPPFPNEPDHNALLGPWDGER
jgi:hypothetical protein